MHDQSTPAKACAICGAIVARRTTESLIDFAKRQTCGLACAGALKSRVKRKAYDARTCEVCGAGFERRPDEPSDRYQRRKTCSTACAHRLKAQRKQRYPDPKPCVVCGATMVYDPAKEKSSIFNKNKACSVACGAKLAGQGRVGQTIPYRQLRQMPAKICPICGVAFVRRPKELPQSYERRITCSRACRYTHASRARRRLPGYRSGKGFYPYTWTHDYREQIRERDGRACQECGVLEAGRLHHVHHVDYDKANLDPSNLITMCASCHCRTNFRRDYWRRRLTAHLKRKGHA